MIELDKIDSLIERGAVRNLLPGMKELFDEAGQIWDENENDFHFRDFIAAD